MKREPVVEALETEVDIGTPADSGGVGCCDTPGAFPDDVAGSGMKSKPVGFVGGILEDRVGKELALGGVDIMISL